MKKINYQSVFVIVIFLAAVSVISYSVWSVNTSVVAVSAPGVQPLAKNLVASESKLEIMA